LTKEETVSSARSHGDPNFEPDWVEYSFTAWAQCANLKCKQKCAISGRGGIAPEYTNDEGDWDWEDYFTPLNCHPMPDMISIPENCPTDIADELKSAFRVYWDNPSACAGRIRVALEHLMNHLGVPKRKKKAGGGMAGLTLHSRIDVFASNEPVIGNQLMALKWLGNAGSHDGKVAKADLLDAFEILEHVLSEILEKKSARVAGLAKKLLRKHGR
jgi:hypothetical protein